ncbi:hypothetical protein SKAU_G00115800 [Synaphobranchus kaupii]|uniref:Uncharacterized protein n=1 Tax=Synaphobranchus kaupii TaxID=118154 RepID=A0A9Q1J0Y5_SYNKA|nr:hypothetical protein SKAU_G00115800 [Synaphobranchus kaupii]
MRDEDLDWGEREGAEPVSNTSEETSIEKSPHDSSAGSPGLQRRPCKRALPAEHFNAGRGSGAQLPSALPVAADPLICGLHPSDSPSLLHHLPPPLKRHKSLYYKCGGFQDILRDTPED